jgi:prepilin-type N-terminal cleavage/methylation domain-containing protein
MREMAQPRNERRQGGFTLIEVVISSGILALLAGSVLTLMRDASRIFDISVRSAQARRHCVTVVDDLGRTLEQSNGANLVIDSTHPEGDWLTLQVPSSVTNGVITWGADAQHPNAFSRFMLVPDVHQPQLWSLVRRVVDGAGIQLAPDLELVGSVDAPAGMLGKGFIVQRNALNNHFVTAGLRLRLAKDGSVTGAGKDLLRSQQVTIRLRVP